MRETLEELKVIVKNAPVKSTHFQVVDGDTQYFENDWGGFLCCHNGEIVKGQNICDVRSLSDIKRQIELTESLAKAYRSYSMLEQVKQKYNGENKLARGLLKLAYECNEFALPSDLRKDIKSFVGDL